MLFALGGESATGWAKAFYINSQLGKYFYQCTKLVSFPGSSQVLLHGVEQKMKR